MVRDVVERRIALLRHLVDEVRVALGERAAARVLARKADREAFFQQRGERHVLGHAPVEVLARLGHLAARVDRARHGLVDVEAVGDRGDLLPDLLQLGHRNAGLAAAFLVLGQAKARPLAIEPVSSARLERLGLLELGVEIGVHLGNHVVERFFRDDALVHQAARIEFARRGLVTDLRVHLRLGHRRVIALVVTEAAIAEHVDDDVLAELLAVFGGDLGGIDHRLGIIAVHVEHRRIDHLRHV